MNKQTKLIHEKKWDILIVLDACRYDTFAKYCREYLGEGWLCKLTSPGTWTVAWLHKTFYKTNMKDVIYVSSNPYINSKDIATPFKSKDVFGKVVDAWNEGFDTITNFLPPSETNKYSFISIDLNRRKRFIIHYMQPHEPYIIYGEKNHVKGKFSMLKKIVFEFVSDNIMWTIMDKFGFEPWSYTEQLWREYGKEGIIEGYEENLKIVLKSVKQFITKYPNKKIVITADHGERLGERNRYGHGGRRDKWVTTIPWFEVGNESKK